MIGFRVEREGVPANPATIADGVEPDAGDVFERAEIQKQRVVTLARARQQLLCS